VEDQTATARTRQTIFQPVVGTQSALPALQKLMNRKPTFEPLCYRTGKTGGELVICVRVLEHFHAHRQTQASASEVGGQLFAEFQPGRICICLATGQASADKRSRFWFVPDQKRQTPKSKSTSRNGCILSATGIRIPNRPQPHPARI
jgi:hypothetical protein